MKREKIKERLNKIIHRTYYYVPPCPFCGSPITGYFVKLRRENDIQWQINECLRHGELIEPVEEMSDKNCFCTECGAEFKAAIETKFLSQEEIDKEKTRRMTRRILNLRIDEAREEYRNDHSAFKLFKRFVGKI